MHPRSMRCEASPISRAFFSGSPRAGDQSLSNANIPPRMGPAFSREILLLRAGLGTTGPVKNPHARDFLLCVLDQVGVDCLLSLKDRIYAFGRNDFLALVVKDKG